MMEPQKYTSLFGGERVRKDDLRVEACGALDELSSHLGLLAAAARAERRLVACEIDVAVPYLNRLSGYLFALARYFNFFHHTDEINL